MHDVKDLQKRYRDHWTMSLVRNYLEDDADGLAAGIAFGALFSLMPILIVTFLVIILVLYLVQRLPIDGRAKQIVQIIVVVIGILSLLKYIAVF